MCPQPHEGDSAAEPWRQALEAEMTSYTADHYKNGACAVFGHSSDGTVTLVACIEDHQFQPKNFWSVAVIGNFLKRFSL